DLADSSVADFRLDHCSRPNSLPNRIDLTNLISLANLEPRDGNAGKDLDGVAAHNAKRLFHRHGGSHLTAGCRRICADTLCPSTLRRYSHSWLSIRPRNCAH